jgi:hypothetical protein
LQAKTLNLGFRSLLATASSWGMRNLAFALLASLGLRGAGSRPSWGQDSGWLLVDALEALPADLRHIVVWRIFARPHGPRGCGCSGSDRDFAAGGVSADWGRNGFVTAAFCRRCADLGVSGLLTFVVGLGST